VNGLALAARHGRLLLILGLAAGALLPGLASMLKPWLQELVALLLFLAALLVGPDRAAGSLHRAGSTLGIVLVYQLLLPLAATALALALGIAGTPAALAVILMLSAPSISGSPNLAILSGADPAPAFRLLILGTALLPVTVLPVLHLLPALGDGGQVLRAALRLLAVIGGAAALAFVLRRTFLRQPDARAIAALDGASALTMAIVVIGLMSAVGPALRTAPASLLGWLGFAFLVNFGFQIAAALWLRRTGGGLELPAKAIVAGNRNIALFLVALPPATTDQLLMFIGCYQVPMYTTPLLLSAFYRWTARD
jgi:Kef-type K+ transport system membrane component KefB